MPVSARTVVTVAKPTKKFTFDIAQQFTNSDTNYGLDFDGTNKEGYLRWTLNQLSYRVTRTSKLLASYYDMQFPLAINATKSIKIDLNDEVRIVFQNHAALNGVCEQHPWHLHGYDFKILGVYYSYKYIYAYMRTCIFVYTHENLSIFAYMYKYVHKNLTEI
jgi:FtsP/CotA-like multicopper oxidase with cupredoxin domain